MFVQFLFIDDMEISVEIRLVSQREWYFVGGATSQSLKATLALEYIISLSLGIIETSDAQTF